MQKSKIYAINNDQVLLTKLKETTINEGVFVEIRIHVGRVKLWPQVLREETVRTLRCGGSR